MEKPKAKHSQRQFKSAKAYQKSSVQTATPEKVLLLLYEGAIRFLKEAMDAIDKKDLPRKGTLIVKALAIVHELQCSLNFNVDSELCGELESLYLFVTDKLTEANINIDKAPIEDSIQILETLLSGFKVAVEEVSKNGYPKISPK